MPARSSPDLRASVLGAWRTNNGLMRTFVRQLPDSVWEAAVPDVKPRRPIRAIAAHIHNARCQWIRILGREHGLTTPARVDHRRVTRRQLVAALKQSGTAMERLLALGLARGGELPPSKGYVWRNLSLDVGHVLTYFVAHEAHHRGQIVMAARQAGHRLPAAAVNGLWWWRPRTGGARR